MDQFAAQYHAQVTNRKKDAKLYTKKGSLKIDDTIGSQDGLYRIFSLAHDHSQSDTKPGNVPEVDSFFSLVDHFLSKQKVIVLVIFQKM